MHMKLSSTAAALGAIATVASAYPQHYDNDLAVRDAEAEPGKLGDAVKAGVEKAKAKAKDPEFQAKVKDACIQAAIAGACKYTGRPAPGAGGMMAMAQGYAGQQYKRSPEAELDDVMELYARGFDDEEIAIIYGRDPVKTAGLAHAAKAVGRHGGTALDLASGAMNVYSQYKSSQSGGYRKRDAMPDFDDEFLELLARDPEAFMGMKHLAKGAKAMGRKLGFGRKHRHQGGAGGAEGAAPAPEGESPQRRDAEPDYYEDELSMLAVREAFPDFDEEALYDLYARDPEAFLGFNHLKKGIKKLGRKMGFGKKKHEEGGEGDAPERRAAESDFDEEFFSMLAARDALPDIDDELLYELYVRDPEAFLGFNHLKKGVKAVGRKLGFGKKKHQGGGEGEGAAMEKREAEPEAFADPELFSEEEMFELMARDPDAFLGFNHLKKGVKAVGRKLGFGKKKHQQQEGEGAMEKREAEPEFDEDILEIMARDAFAEADPEADPEAFFGAIAKIGAKIGGKILGGGHKHKHQQRDAEAEFDEDILEIMARDAVAEAGPDADPEALFGAIAKIGAKIGGKLLGGGHKHKQQQQKRDAEAEFDDEVLSILARDAIAEAGPDADPEALFGAIAKIGAKIGGKLLGGGHKHKHQQQQKRDAEAEFDDDVFEIMARSALAEAGPDADPEAFFGAIAKIGAKIGGKLLGGKKHKKHQQQQKRDAEPEFFMEELFVRDFE